MFDRLEDPAPGTSKSSPGRARPGRYVKSLSSFGQALAGRRKTALLAGRPVNELLTRGRDRIAFRPDRNGPSRRGGFAQRGESGRRSIFLGGFTRRACRGVGSFGRALKARPSGWDRDGSHVEMIRSYSPWEVRWTLPPCLVHNTCLPSSAQTG